MTVQSEHVMITNGEWSLTLVGDHMEIEALPADGPDAPWQPRAGNGVGVGIPLGRLDSLIAAVQAMLADPVARDVIAAHGAERPAWSRPGIDRTERVVYLHGPVRITETGPGHTLTPRFGVPVETVRQLCTRLRSVAASSIATWQR
jgi:hypothetical protein